MNSKNTDESSSGEGDSTNRVAHNVRREMVPDAHKGRFLSARKVLWIMLGAACMCYVALDVVYTRNTRDEPREYDPLLEEPNDYNTTWYTPRIIPLDDSGFVYYDGMQTLLAEGREATPVEVEDSLLLDTSTIQGVSSLYLKRDKVYTFDVSGLGSESELRSGKYSVRNVVVDSRRRVIHCVGRDKTFSKDNSEGIRRSSLEDIIYTCDLAGTMVGDPYYVGESVSVVSRDKYCDKMAVGTLSGAVHVFSLSSGRCVSDGHVNLESGKVVDISCEGDYVAVATDSESRAYCMHNDCMSFAIAACSAVANQSGHLLSDEDVRRVCVLNSQYAAFSCGSVIECIDLSRRMLDHSVTVPGRVVCMCRAHKPYEIAILSTEVGGSEIFTLNVRSGELVKRVPYPIGASE